MADRGEDEEPASTRDPHRDLAGVLHDVSNALTVVLGWVGEARSPDVTPERLGCALAVIEQRARMARDLARQAIGDARIDEHKAAGAIAREVVDALFVEASRAGATVVVSGADVAAKVSGALDVTQVLTNLVLNALAYAPRGSQVEIDVVAEDGSCRITVADAGPGVPEARRDAIFEGRSHRPGGTGVGLRHSRALARLWGGEIELLSSTPSSGARFCVRWPRADAVPRPPVSSARERGLSGTRVLVVEDDRAVSQLLETALEGRGATVTVASTSAELAAAMAAGPYDAALLDLSPIGPDVGGALRRLRLGSPEIDVVLITGSVDRLPDAIASEALKLVRKPFDLSEIMAALSKKP